MNPNSTLSPDCIFCKIIRKEISAHKILESDHSLAFLDIKPHAQGHTVVIPKTHAETIFDLPLTESQHLLEDVIKTMRLLEQLHPDGFNVGWNHQSAAGQVVPHLHLHIFPRYQGDGGGSMHSIIKNPGSKSPEDIIRMLKKK